MLLDFLFVSLQALCALLPRYFYFENNHLVGNPVEMNFWAASTHLFITDGYHFGLYSYFPTETKI